MTARRRRFTAEFKKREALEAALSGGGGSPLFCKGEFGRFFMLPA